MTKEDLSKLLPKNFEELDAQDIVEAWESRFPDSLTEDSRYLLYHMIKDSINWRLHSYSEDNNLFYLGKM